MGEQGGSFAKADDAEGDLVARSFGDALQFELFFGQGQHVLVAHQREQVRILV